MRLTLTRFTGAIALAMVPAAHAFVSFGTRLTAPRLSGSLSHKPQAAAAAAVCRPRQQPRWFAVVLGASAEEGGGEGSVAGDGGKGAEGGASKKSKKKPAEPVGSSGAVEDDLLVELVGQDYGMMSLLRNDKFKGLIVFLRNVPPDEWVAEVARAYPGDDEVKGMLGQVGKLMRMMDYYEAKKPGR